jgi:hypothetical protein
MTDVPSLNAAAQAAQNAEAARKREEVLMALRARREAVEWRASGSLFEEHGPRTEAAEREIVRQVAEDAARRRLERLRAAAAAPPSPPPAPQPERQEWPVHAAALARHPPRRLFGLFSVASGA